MTSQTTSDPRQPGYVVAGKYRVDRLLGEGGMGIVVAATHEQLDQKVALKFLLPEVMEFPEYVQRFMREARAAVKIQSEHVARVLDVGTHDGAPYMVMEYLEGKDLSQVIEERGALPAEEAVGYVLEACEAIAEAHSHSIIHRDLKPANLFIATRPSGRPTVKVLDFGISKAPAKPEEASMTRTSEIMGSPAYMSPEQMASASSVDGRSDIWSLGVVLYELLVQKPPFIADTMPGLVAAILQNPPEPIGAVRGDLPPGLQAVVERCLEKSPAKRYANIAELARALAPFGPPRGAQSVERIEHVLKLTSVPPPPHTSSRPPPPTPSSPPMAGGPIAIRVSPASSTSGDAALAGAATFAPTTSQSTPPRRMGLVIVPIALVAVCGVSAAAFFALRPPPIKSSAEPAAVTSTTPIVAPSASATTAPIATPAASAESIAASSAPSASATAVVPPPPLRPYGRPNQAAATATATATTPTCKTVSYFDADGNKHFKQVCP